MYYSYYELYHHGIKGQRWGVRRYQNEDGSLTSSGRARYRTDKKWAKDTIKMMNNMERSIADARVESDKQHTLSEKYAKKSNKAYEKGNTAKAEKYAKKTLEARAKRDALDNEIKDSDKALWQSVGALASKGFDVKISDKQFTGSTKRGKALGYGLLSGIGGIASGDIKAVMGKKYSASWSKNPDVGNVYMDFTEPKR